MFFSGCENLHLSDETREPIEPQYFKSKAGGKLRSDLCGHWDVIYRLGDIFSFPFAYYWNKTANKKVEWGLIVVKIDPVLFYKYWKNP